LLISSSFSLVFKALFSASASRFDHSFFFTISVILSTSLGSSCNAVLHLFSNSVSSDISSRASSGQELTHFGSPPQRSQAMTVVLSGWWARAPCGQACMHQSQPLHLSSSTVRKPFSSDCFNAFSGHAVTQRASLQNLQAMAALRRGCMRTTRILDIRMFQVPSDFSNAQTYSQSPQPVQLLGSAAIYFLELSFVICSSFVKRCSPFKFFHAYAINVTYFIVAFSEQSA